jgi:serine/threonine protein kinase
MVGGPEVISAAQREFEELWEIGGSPPHPGEFLRRYSNEPADVRRFIAHEVVRVDLAQRWDRWKQHSNRVATGTSLPPAPVLSDYLKLCPDLGTLDSIPPALVEFEYRTRTSCGDQVSVNDYCTLYPHATSAFEATVHSRETKSNEQNQTVIEDPTQPTPVKRPGELPAKFNNYEVIRELGRGAMGVVYLARHTVLESQIAIKAILTDKFPSKHEVNLFLNEARIAGNLYHENIVRVLDAGEYEGHYFIAMEFVAGGGLDERIREHPLDQTEAARLTRTVAEAMHYAHTQPAPVFHRDIKPANILITEDGTPYVCDFGIAKRIETGQEQRNTVAGTPSYMPPEQAQARTVDARSDVYSLGAMLYALIVGRPPFAAGNAMQTLKQVIELDPVAPSQLDPSVSRDLEAICLKCLDKNPDARYQSAQLLADDIQNFLSDRPIVARPPSLLARFDKWKRRNPAMARMVLLVFTMLVAVSVSSIAVAFKFHAQEVEAVGLKHEAQQNAKEADVQRQIADKKKADAELNAKLAKEAEAEATKQRLIADEKKLEAESNEKLAKAAEVEAKKQKGIAENNERLAKKAGAEATKQRLIADEKKREAENNERLAKAAEDAAKKQKGVAENNLNVASAAIDVLIMELADKGLDDIPGMQNLRRDIVTAAGSLLQELAAQPENASPEIRVQTATAFLRLGLINKLGGETEKARQSFQSAYDAVDSIDQDITARTTKLQALRGLAEVASDKDQEERQLFEATTLARQLAINAPNDPDAVFEAALTFNSFGVCLSDLQSQEEAIDRFEDSQNYYHRLLTFPGDFKQKNEWGRRYAESLNNLAVQLIIHERERDLQKAIGLYLTAFEIQLSLLNGKGLSLLQQPSGQSPDVLRYKAVDLVNRYVTVLQQRGQQRSRVMLSDAAQTLLNAAIACNRMVKLIIEDKPDAATAWHNLALTVSKQAISGYSELASDFPSIPDYPLRQSAAVQSRVIASFDDGSNSVPPLVKTANEQIQFCSDQARRFPTRSMEFTNKKIEWTTLRDEMARSQ